jgi:hypothetical protein
MEFYECIKCYAADCCAGSKGLISPQPTFAAASVPQQAPLSNGRCGSSSSDAGALRRRAAEDAEREARKQAALQHIRSQGEASLLHRTTLLSLRATALMYCK